MPAIDIRLQIKSFSCCFSRARARHTFRLFDGFLMHVSDIINHKSIKTIVRKELNVVAHFELSEKLFARRFYDPASAVFTAIKFLSVETIEDAVIAIKLPPRRASALGLRWE
jgi:hypothetical protein